METKILFSVDYDGELINEALNAEISEEGMAQIKNSPFYVYGIAFDDIVSFKKTSDGVCVFNHCVQHSGNSTLRIALFETCLEDEILAEFNKFNCGIETSSLHNFNLLSINIPQESLIHLNYFYQYLEEKYMEGILEYEEGFIFSNLS
jgi:hypothetical protein